MKKKEKLSEKIERAKENSLRTKTLRELCERIFDAFEMPGGNNCVLEGPEPSVLIDELAPWQNLVPDSLDENPFNNLYRAIKTSFAIGYVVGQALDVPEIDTKPILDFLREKKSLLYLPHEKKAA
jgi:hypothetical protein